MEQDQFYKARKQKAFVSSISTNIRHRRFIASHSAHILSLLLTCFLEVSERVVYWAEAFEFQEY